MMSQPSKDSANGLTQNLLASSFATIAVESNSVRSNVACFVHFTINIVSHSQSIFRYLLHVYADLTV